MNKDYNEHKIKETAGELAAAFVKNYKCSLQEAENYFLENILKQDDLAKLISSSVNAKQLGKNAMFKNFVKKGRKELYYKLRQYKNNDDHRQALLDLLEESRQNPSAEMLAELLERTAVFHVSSQERFEDNDVFYQQLSSILEQAETIVDIGCGVQPLFFPFEKYPSLKKYIALDKDAESVRLMQSFKEIFAKHYQCLHPREWAIGRDWNDILASFELERFDVALLLKLVPVVQRTHPEQVSTLLNIPANVLVVSGVKESMVKKQDIERREKRSVLNFIEAGNRQQLSQFSLQQEFIIIAS
jgi:hypothetical protein